MKLNEKYEKEGPSEAGGLGLPPNDKLKFVDFVSDEGCKSQGRRNEDSNSYIYEEATRIYQKCNIFRCHRSLKFQNFCGKTPISRDPLLPSMAHFCKSEAFSNDLNDVVMKKSPEPRFYLLRSHLASPPPI